MKKFSVGTIVAISLCCFAISLSGYPEYLDIPLRENLLLENKVFDPDTIVLSGGVAKGVAYAGTLRYLEEAGKLENVSRFAGSSAGSIFAFICYLGISSEEADEIIKNIDWPSLVDSDIPLLKIMKDFHLIWKDVNYLKAIGDLAAFWGLTKGDAIENLLRGILKKQGFTDDGYITFAQIKGRVEARIPENSKVKSKDLYVVACSMAYNKTAVLSFSTTPNMDVVSAIRASMAIPFIFMPLKVDKNGEAIKNFEEAYDVLVDGGTTYNYPIEYFDKMGAKSLGFVLSPKDAYFNPPRKEIRHIGNYTSACMSLLTDNIGPRIIANEDRTIFIDTKSVGTLSFDMTPAERDEAINQGYLSTKEYFE